MVPQVPRVFIDGKCIGGGSETVALKNSGELQKVGIDDSNRGEIYLQMLNLPDKGNQQ